MMARKIRPWHRFATDLAAVKCMHSDRVWCRAGRCAVCRLPGDPHTRVRDIVNETVFTQDAESSVTPITRPGFRRGYVRQGAGAVRGRIFPRPPPRLLRRIQRYNIADDSPGCCSAAAVSLLRRLGACASCPLQLLYAQRQHGEASPRQPE
jgi:hypothetical protein